MASINTRRIWLGALAGAAAWFVWTNVVHLGILAHRYGQAMADHHLMQQPRYQPFPVFWFLTLYLVSLAAAWLYAGIRQTYGPGPKTAVVLGIVLGFAAGFPLTVSTVEWTFVGRVIPFWWMLDIWVGVILSTFVSAWLYKES